MDDLVNRTNKQSKKPANTEEIIKLSRSESVNNAVLKTVQTPENGSQFERDYKSFKGDQKGKLDYLLKTVKTSEVIKKIFKSNLETDLLIDMVKVFKFGLNEDKSENFG